MAFLSQKFFNNDFIKIPTCFASLYHLTFFCFVLSNRWRHGRAAEALLPEAPVIRGRRQPPVIRGRHKPPDPKVYRHFLWQLHSSGLH